MSTEPTTVVATEVSLYPDVEAQLAAVKVNNDQLVFDYEDEAGNKAARQHVHKLRKIKGAIDSQRKDLKAESLARGRLIDSAAKDLTERVEDMIAVHAGPIKEIEQREVARINLMESLVNNILNYETNHLMPVATADEVMEVIKQLEAIDISAEVYQERMAEAITIRKSIVVKLEERHAGRVKSEAEAAELARLREEEAARKQKEHEDRIAREAAEQAQAEAEAKAKAEADAAAQREQALKEQAVMAAQAAREAKARQELLEEAQEQAKLRAKEAEVEKAEREAYHAKKEAEHKASLAAAEAYHEELRKKEAKEEADRARQAEANNLFKTKQRRAAEAEVCDAICKNIDTHTGIGIVEAACIVEAIIAGKIPHLTITY